MKLLFIPAGSKLKVSFPSSQVKKLPKKIGLTATVQFTGRLKKIKAFLEEQGRQVFISKGRNSCLEGGQILGCNVNAAKVLEKKVQAFIYIGSGKFHPLHIALALKKQKPIFIFNPLTNEFSELDQKDIARAKIKKKVQKINFLSAGKFGILVSTKPGQEKLKQALLLKNKLKKQGKVSHVFLFDTFDENQLENWPEIDCWINTACPGLSLENSRLAWIDDII